MKDPGGRVKRALNTVRTVRTDTMPTFDVDRKQINAFPVDDTYLFKQYFEEGDVFGELRQYYNEEEYRFEVPREAVDEVRSVLDDAFYDLVMVDDLDAFCVITEKDTKHPDVLFKNAVMQRSKREYNVFLLKDQLAVEQVVNHGARRLSETDLEATL